MTRDKATRIEVLESKIEEIEANMASVDEHLGKLPDGPIRVQFAEDKADFQRELDRCRAELEALRAS
jgi:hypothetical protein